MVIFYLQFGKGVFDVTNVVSQDLINTCHRAQDVISFHPIVQFFDLLFIFISQGSGDFVSLPIPPFLPLTVMMLFNTKRIVELDTSFLFLLKQFDQLLLEGLYFFLLLICQEDHSLILGLILRAETIQVLLLIRFEKFLDFLVGLILIILTKRPLSNEGGTVHLGILGIVYVIVYVFQTLGPEPEQTMHLTGLLVTSPVGELGSPH